MNAISCTCKAAAIGSAGLLFMLSDTANAADDWEFDLSPLFLWGLSIEGDATIDGKTAPLDLEFKDDILENIEAVFTLYFEARRGNLSFFTEYQYVDLEPDTEAYVGPVSVKADVDFEEQVWELGAGWAFSESDRTRWEIIGGGRYTDQDINVDVNLSGPLPPGGPSGKVKGGDDWWHAFAGVRVFHSLGKNWSFIGRADYGYGGSDNSAANLAFMFDYRFNNWGSAFIGGRYLSYDYEDSAYAFDADKTGPLAGLTIHW